jgi:hypothetical protein
LCRSTGGRNAIKTRHNTFIDFALEFFYNYPHMARKKKFFGGQVSGKSFSQMLGLFFILGAVVTLASFFHQFPGLSDVLLLSDVNFQLHKQLGWFALLLPIILLMVATHFFGKKRKRLIRPHTTIGSGIYVHPKMENLLRRSVPFASPVSPLKQRGVGTVRRR